ncbi:uncharacterized protein G2W53_032542 [Senna tora]|uniref:Uncharacterized protein n=1 Tax=Senna tora TaxID=362788 RepID=A0A834WAB3_9FABA|nr:uncharacterized protein G2W53_032542 [Senna tora]
MATFSPTSLVPPPFSPTPWPPPLPPFSPQNAPSPIFGLLLPYVRDAIPVRTSQ